MAVCNEYDTAFCRFRGDTQPHKIRITDPTVSPTAVDITGFTFSLTVNTKAAPNAAESPATGTEIFTIPGTITSAVAGEVEFVFTPVLADQLPRTYYYDIQMIDTGGLVRTIAKGEYIFHQDITK